MSRRGDRGQAAFLRVAARIPVVIWWPLGRAASLLLAALPPRSLRQWARNVELATGKRPGLRMRAAAQFSWLRNTVGSLQLGRWSRRKIVRKIEVDQTRLAMLQRLHAEQGLVLALPHMGSWDLAGAFACQVGLPVTSVAERLPAGLYEYFRALRARLGFEIHPYDKGDLVRTLSDDLRRGRVICLVADRDFGRRGLPVRWPAATAVRELTLPAGPVLIAQQTGAALVPITCHFAGARMRITICEPVVGQTGRDGAILMAQELADSFATAIASHPADWHMMQRFFPGEAG